MSSHPNKEHSRDNFSSPALRSEASRTSKRSGGSQSRYTQGAIERMEGQLADVVKVVATLATTLTPLVATINTRPNLPNPDEVTRNATEPFDTANISPLTPGLNPPAHLLNPDTGARIRAIKHADPITHFHLGNRDVPSTPGELAKRLEFPTALSDGLQEDTVPPKFKMPSLGQYDGSKDPHYHVHRFLDIVSFHDVPEGVKCMLFAFTLKDTARNWYNNLPVRSIHSFGEPVEDFLA